jgi:CMP-N,N'-diacetyllegionaminic acid synthase
MAESRVLGILPARGGSKGIPGKNLKPLSGKPLIAWAATALSNAAEVEQKICSTDDSHIAQVAQAYGLRVPWLRPPELALDDTLVVDVIEHALRSILAEQGICYSHIALIQATSPTVTATDIDAAIRLAIETDADTVITGFHAGQRHPATMYTMEEDGSVQWLLEQRQRMARRQDLPPIFVRTGLVYVIKAEIILERHSIYGDRIMSLIIPEERAITIDEESDFRLAEFLLNGETQ